MALLRKLFKKKEDTSRQEPEILYQQLYLMAIEEITGKNIYRNGGRIWISDGTEAVCKLNDGVLYIIGT